MRRMDWKIAAVALGVFGAACSGNGVNGMPADMVTRPMVDGSVAVDLSTPIDFAQGREDLSTGQPDLATTRDMTSGFGDMKPGTSPGSTVWLSSGGGPLTATSKRQLNLSLGGNPTPVTGTAKATSGATITWGKLSTDTY